MEFSEKIELIEKARADYPEFDEEFKEYLGRGFGTNGAYNHFTLEDIEKHAPKKVVVPVEKVVIPTKTTAKVDTPKKTDEKA
jgi:hypothetical protein